MTSPTPDLAYTTALALLDPEESEHILGDLRLRSGGGETWHVYRHEQSADVIETEIDVIYPHRFGSAQQLASHLHTLATATEKEWPAIVGGNDE